MPAPQSAILLSNNTIVGPFIDPEEVDKWFTDNGFTYFMGHHGHIGSKYRGVIMFQGIEIEMSACVFECKAPTDDWLPPDTHLPK